MPLVMQNNIDPMIGDMAVEENENTEKEPVVVESTSLDLESYAANYIGLAKLNRLIFIADMCPPLQIEALQMAINYVQTTCNVNLYSQLYHKLQKAVSPGTPLTNWPDVTGQGAVPLPNLDVNWIEMKTKSAATKLERLDSDLKNSRVNSIKESIRRGHDELGDHHLDCGDLANALKCYTRARDYCTSSKHVVNMCLNVIQVSVYLNNWPYVLNYVSKALGTSEYSEVQPPGSKDQSAVIHCKLTCAAGLAQLATNKYKAAAKSFLAAQLDACDFPELLSPSDVAMYGGLCALATFSRSKIQKQVISSSSFKLFLEVEPQLRDVIFKFYESDYASCLKLLDDMKDSLMLDIYLSPHVNTLYADIRNRGLIQYFSPYKSADLGKMAVAFNTNVSSLEDELMALILDGQIQARIDSHNKILYAKAVEERSMTFEKSLEMGREHVQRVNALILRSALINNQIHVKSPPREGSGQGASSCADVSMGTGVINSASSGPRN